MCLPDVEVRLLDCDKNWRKILRDRKDIGNPSLVYKVVESKQYWSEQNNHVHRGDTTLVNENCVERCVERLKVPIKRFRQRSNVCARCHILSCNGACNNRLICAKCFCCIDNFLHHDRVCISQLRNRLNFKSRTGKVLQTCSVHNISLLLGDVCPQCDPNVCVFFFMLI